LRGGWSVRQLDRIAVIVASEYGRSMDKAGDGGTAALPVKMKSRDKNPLAF
jgi:hypothetical protein